MTTPTSHIPQTLCAGRYLLVEPIGEGGMAVVYRAFDQRLQVWRAVKVLNAKYGSSKKVKARFDTEAQTMALLEHPNIVRVYDVGSIGEISYIVMELVEGGTPVDWLERWGAMPPRLALRVTEQICHGIEAAHAKGVIHRDIKPHNVMLTLDGTCRVTDFGIARVGEPDQSMTKTGAVMGTWGYMAPEQRSDAKAVDQRGDVYAIAATLYTLVSNRIPMDLFAADRDATMMSGVPDELYDVMLKATNYDRDERYSTVADLRVALADVYASLGPDPADTPALVSAPLDRLGPPSAEIMARATPLVDEATGRVIAPTLLPETSLSDVTEVPVLNRGSVPPAESPPRRRRGIFVWLVALVPLLLGVVLLGVAAVVALPSLLGQGQDTAIPEDTDAIVDVVEPETDLPEPLVDSDAVVEAPPEPDPVVRDPIVRDPVVVKPDPVVVKPDPNPVVIIVDPKPDPVVPEPDTDVAVAVAVIETPPLVEQCIKVVPPDEAQVGLKTNFEASFCVEDGISSATLWYRPVGTEGWQSVGMPKRLGAYRANVMVDERFSRGIQFYVEGGDVTYGSRNSPRRVKVR